MKITMSTETARKLHAALATTQDADLAALRNKVDQAGTQSRQLSAAELAALIRVVELDAEAEFYHPATRALITTALPKLQIMRATQAAREASGD